MIRLHPSIERLWCVERAGVELRRLYNGVLKEPLPDWTKELLAKLDGAPPLSTAPGRGDGAAAKPTRGG